MTDPIDTLVELTREKRRLKEMKKELNAEIAAAEKMILQEWLSKGTQNQKRNGATVYVQREMTVKVLNPELLAERLDGALPLRPHGGQLKSWMKERCWDDRLGEWRSEVPAELQGVVEVDEFHKLGVRGA